jgi:hypothetical protein
VKAVSAAGRQLQKSAPVVAQQMFGNWQLQLRF